MSYCLNPSCEKPQNPDGTNFCLNCGMKILPLLRNRYRIIRPLGGGGFGRTFLAEDEDKLHEECVVKQLSPQVQGTSALRKATQLFQEEARRLQQLGEHPQIPTLYGYFEQDNYLYLVQQLIIGQTLRQELELGTFSEQKIWELLTSLLPILKFVHEHQVIHRDIKPENIIRRDRDRKLVLIDFGVAKKLTANVLEMTGTSIGSVGYAPLEQMQHGSASPASDLFSLGATCFHLLSGIHPSHLWTEQGYGWVARWRQYLSPISQELELVLDKLLKKDIQQRYQSVEQVLQDLDSPPLSGHQEVLSVTQTFVSPSLPLEMTSLPPSAFPQVRLANAPVAAIQRWAKPLKIKLLIGGAIALLALSGFTYWQRDRIPTLRGHSGEVNTVVFFPDGQNIATGSDDKTIKIWSLSKFRHRTIKGHSDWVYSIALSLRGDILASGSKDNTVKVWNPNTGTQIRTFKGHSSLVNSVALAPNGKLIASGSYDKTIKVWNLNSGLVRTLTGHESEILSVAISPNGQKLISASEDKMIKVWNLNSGKLLHTLKGHSDDVNAIAISPDGENIASVSDDKSIKIWNLNTGRDLRTLTGHTADVNSVAFSPDGENIATGSDDKTIKIWNLNTGEELATFKGHSRPVFAIAISQDGQTLVSASEDKTIKIWQMPK